MYTEAKGGRMEKSFCFYVQFNVTIFLSFCLCISAKKSVYNKAAFDWKVESIMKK